jgi:hypothetical protein
MDFPPPAPPSSAPSRRRFAAGLAVAALALYTVLLVKDVGAVAAGSDSSGYMNHAKLLMSGHLHVPARTIPGLPPSSMPPMTYVPLGFKPAPDGNGLVPTYAVGFPLLVALAEPLSGWRHAGDLAVILHSLAGIAATYGLARLMGLGRRGSVFAAAVVALSPLYLFMSLQAMSDVPSLAWTAFAVMAAIRSRDQAVWAAAAGAAMAVDVLLRPTNILALVPVAIALGVSPRRWLLLAAGALPGAVLREVHSLDAYGGLFATGYPDTSPDFGSRFVGVTVIHYAFWLPILFTPAVLLGVCLPWVAAVPARTRWILATWILAFEAFYSTYRCTHETWWYLRFMLPAAPAMAIAAAVAARWILARAPSWADPARSLAAFAAALALVGVNSAWRSHQLNALGVGADELRYVRLADWMRSNLPKDAVVLNMQASGSIFYYTDLTFLRWDSLDKASIPKAEAALRLSGRPLYAVLFPYEVDDHVLEQTLKGNWVRVGSVSDITVWRRDPAPPPS